MRTSILRTGAQEIDTSLEEERKITDAFAYEKQLFERAMRVGKTMLEGQGCSSLKNIYLSQNVKY